MTMNDMAGAPERMKPIQERMSTLFGRVNELEEILLSIGATAHRIGFKPEQKNDEDPVKETANAKPDNLTQKLDLLEVRMIQQVRKARDVHEHLNSLI